jgi:hypothetical protein
MIKLMASVVVLVAAVTEGFLLDAAADLVDHLRPEADDMKGVEHRDRVAELVPHERLWGTEEYARLALRAWAAPSLADDERLVA